MPADVISIDERKKKLVAQGVAFRARVIYAKNNVHAGLRPDALMMGSLSHIAESAKAVLGNRHVVDVAGAKLLPLLVSGISVLSKGSLRKPVMRVVVVSCVAAAIATLLLMKKKAQVKASES